MDTHDKFWLSILLLGFSLIFLVGIVYGTPTTAAATGLSPGGFTAGGTGVTAGNVWFTLGTNPNSLSVKFGNFTLGSGTVSQVLNGSPLYGGITYYYKICDGTGCDPGAAQSFTLPPVPTVTQTSFSLGLSNITQGNFNVMYIGSDLLYPLQWLGGVLIEAILIAAFELIIFFSLWRSGGSTRIPAIIACITGVFLWGNGAQQLGLGIPADFMTIGAGIFIVSLTGLAMSFIKRG